MEIVQLINAFQYQFEENAICRTRWLSGERQCHQLVELLEVKASDSLINFVKDENMNEHQWQELQRTYCCIFSHNYPSHLLLCAYYLVNHTPGVSLLVVLPIQLIESKSSYVRSYINIIYNGHRLQMELPIYTVLLATNIVNGLILQFSYVII